MTLADIAKRCRHHNSPAQAGNGDVEGLQQLGRDCQRLVHRHLSHQHLCLSTASLNMKHWLKREHAGRQLSKTLAESCKARSKDAGIAQASPATPSRRNPAPLPPPAAVLTEGPRCRQLVLGGRRLLTTSCRDTLSPAPSAQSPLMPCPRCGGLEIPQVCPPNGLRAPLMPG